MLNKRKKLNMINEWQLNKTAQFLHFKIKIWQHMIKKIIKKREYLWVIVILKACYILSIYKVKCGQSKKSLTMIFFNHYIFECSQFLRQFLIYCIISHLFNDSNYHTLEFDNQEE